MPALVPCASAAAMARDCGRSPDAARDRQCCEWKSGCRRVAGNDSAVMLCCTRRRLWRGRGDWEVWRVWRHGCA